MNKAIISFGLLITTNIASRNCAGTWRSTHGVTTSWCADNCYAPGTGDLHPSCDPNIPNHVPVCICQEPPTTASPSNSQFPPGMCDGGTGVTGILGDTRFQYVLDALQNPLGHGFTMDSAIVKGQRFTGASMYQDFEQLASIPFLNQVTEYSVSVFTNKEPVSYLSVDDVIIWRVCLPPPITYYGVAGYNAAEILNENATLLNYKQSSLGDSINNLNVKSDTGDAFNTPAFFVMSGSQSSFDIVSGLVASAFGAPIAANINFIKVPNGVFSFAESSTSSFSPRDVFSFSFRTVDNSNNSNPLYEIYKTPQYVKPFFVFRKYTAESVGDFAFSEKPLEAETVENTPGQSKKFDEAVEGIIAYFGGLGLSLEDSYPMNGAANLYTQLPPPLPPLPIPVYIQNHGRICLTADPLFGGPPLYEVNQNCIIDNPDTYYSMFGHNAFREPFGFGVQGGEFYVVVGSNTNDNNMSLYNSIGIYNTLKAVQTLPPPPGKLPKVYYPIGTVANKDYANLKDCGVFKNNKHNNVFAVQVAAEGNPFIVSGLNSMTIGPPEIMFPFVFMGRAHLNPQTGTRPKEEELIPWRILKFTPTSQTYDDDEAAMHMHVPDLESTEKTSTNTMTTTSIVVVVFLVLAVALVIAFKYRPTTASPTTASPTTASPTTQSPTTPSPRQAISGQISNVADSWCAGNCYAPGTGDLHPSCDPNIPNHVPVCFSQ